MRLDKYIASSTDYSRKNVKQLIKKGMVKVNNRIIYDEDYKVNDSDIIALNNEIIKHQEFVYLMLNKPSNVVSACSDNLHKTVIDLIDDYKYLDLFPVGRLDIDTLGLLLITNDGKLAHELLAPKKHVDKVYYVEYNGTFYQEIIEKFNKGITYKDEKFASSKFEYISENSCYVTIHEGKFHQVKKMLLAVGLEVVLLQRVKFGPLELDKNLETGEYRELTKQEIEELKNRYIKNA